MMNAMRQLQASACAVAVACLSRLAAAQDPSPAPSSDAESTAPPAAAPATQSPPTTPVLPAKSPERNVSLEPKAALPPKTGRARFVVDPIADTGLITLSTGFAAVLELINSTGEIHPQQISDDFHRSQLLAIDRASITSTPDKNAGTFSNLGLGAAAVFGFIDPVLSGFREQSVQTGLVDAMLYAESTSITFAFTDMVKLAVRRPRPGAYIEAEAHHGELDYSNPSTDSALSFFSGHASVTATIGATATYLAFVRSPHTARPWITLGFATALTTFVSIERVRAGKHFPTDVIAGAVAGAGIGIVVPHLHRDEEVGQRRVWVGYAPTDGQAWGRGGAFSLTGVF
jgi:hypothetical protein